MSATPHGSASPGDGLTGLRDLMQALWVERQLLDFLHFKLATAKLILAADMRRFVPAAIGEVEEVIERFRAAELRREVALSRLAQEWGEPVDRLSLSYVASKAPEPAATILADHRDALHGLAADIEGTAAENRQLARGAIDHIRRNLDVLTGRAGGGTYTPAGRSQHAGAAAHRMDRAL